jgi:hypothetical protein
MNRTWLCRSIATMAFLLGVRAGATETAPPATSATPTPIVTSLASTATRPGKRLHQGFLLRLTLGTVYLYESWSPGGGSPGASYSGLGTSLETSVGRSVLRPGLIVGGKWQFVAVVDPSESYLGRSDTMTESARFLDVFAAFVDDYPNPRRGFHFGSSVGLLAATELDAVYGAHTTSWGAALSAHVGYERFFSSRWSWGALAQLTAYRYSAREAGVSSTSDGLLPTVALAFTFN